MLEVGSRQGSMLEVSLQQYNCGKLVDRMLEIEFAHCLS